MSAPLYQHTAELFDLRYAHKDYAGEAATLSRLLDRIHPRAVTLLDVACGTGRHLEHLRSHYRVEGIDRSHELLKTARKRVGDAPLHEGDMTRFALGRAFDVVTCFFASIAYLGSVEGLHEAVSNMAKHLSAGGVLFIEPFLTPTVYREGEVVHNIRKTPEQTLSWMYVMRRRADVAVWDIHWLVGTAGEDVEHFVEHEELKMFATDEYVRALRDAGLDVCHHARGLHGYGAFLGRKDARWSPDDLASISEILPA